MNCIHLLLLSVGCVASYEKIGVVLYDFFETESKHDNTKEYEEHSHELKEDRQPDMKDDVKKEYNKEFREDIVRPCDLTDWQCMRKFMAANSDCKPAYGPHPDPLHVPYDKFIYPSANMTVTFTDFTVLGLSSAKITEFYVNKYTGNLVIAFNVRDLNQTSPMAYFTYLRTAKEPITLADNCTVNYKSITFTAIIPKVPHLRLDLAEMHPDVHDGFPVYVIGPKAFTSTDPDVIAAFAEITTNSRTTIRELYNFQAYLFGVFIERCLCDFGVDVYNTYIQYLRSKAHTITPYRRPTKEPTKKYSHH